jgi:8-oxo-dGTP pyrophosphatase MutT (NUDIX family)
MGMSPYLERLRAEVGTAFVLLPSAAVLVTRADDGRVLVARQDADPRWIVPGGAVDPDEHPRDAAVRELREETGLVLRDVRLLVTSGGTAFRTEYPNGDVCGYVISLYGATADNPDDAHIVDGELDELRWCHPAELRELDLKPWFAQMLAELDAG